MPIDPAFYPALWSLVALPSGTRPELFLAVWLYESGLEPAAANAEGCLGLNQSCPKSMGGPGFPSDDAAAYHAAPASEQLLWIAPQVLSAVKLNGGPFRSAARYYQANFLPATLESARGPSDVIAAQGGPYAAAYAANARLDMDRNGAITLDDLSLALEQNILRSGATLQNAITQTYAVAPTGAPWAAPALLLSEPPGPSAPSSSSSHARGGARVVLGLGLGLGALALAARHR